MPEIDNESRKWLYQTLTSPEYGLNLGTPQEFDSLMTNNEESRKWLWEQANSFGLNVGANYDEFNSLVNPAPQRTDVSDVQQAEQANAPVAEVATQPQQEAIPTETMEQVDNVGHYQPRSGAELKTPEQLEAEVQNSLPTPTTENEPKPQEVHGENLSGFAYPFNKGLMHEDPNRNDGNFIGNVINNPQKGGKEDASSVELNNAYAATGDQPYELPTELNEVGYNEVLQKKNALIAEKKQIEKRGNMMLDTDIEPSWAERDRNRAKIIEAELDKVLKYEYSYLRTPEGQAYLDRYDEMCDQMDAAIKEAGGDNYSWQGRLGEAFANTSPTDIKSLTPEEEQRQKDMAEYGNKLIKAKRDVKNVRREVRKTRERLNGDYSGFRRGWRATDVEGLSGINDFADKMTQLELAKKVREGKPLDKVDEVLLRANELKSTSDMNLATSDTMWEHIGSSTAEQLVTTAEFLAGSYLTGATDISGKVAGRVMSSMGSKAAEEAVVSSARNLLRAGVAEVAGMAAGAAVQTFANPLSYLSMMADYADKRTGTIYYDQNDGQLHYFDNNKSIALSLWQAAAGAYIENFTEFSGEGIDKIGKLGLNKLFSAAPELKSATETIKGLLDKVKFSDLSGLNAPAMDDFLRHAGFNGTLGEFGEEVLGNIIRPFAYVETENGESYGKQLGRGLKNLVDADQNLETFLSCAITSAVLGTVGTVRRTASDMITNSQQKAYDEQMLKDVRDNIAKLDAMMNGVRGLDKEAFKEFIANNNVADISQYIKEQAKANNWTSDELGMVALYVSNVAQQNAMANQNSEAIQQSIDALNEQTKQLVNEWDGEHIYNVTFKDPKTGEELHGAVVNGRMHYTQNDDGTYNFNPYVSSGMLAIRMEDGSVRQVSSRAVTSLDNVTTAAEQNANQGQIVREMMEDQFKKDELMPTVESAWGFEFEPGATEINGLTFVGKDKDGNYQFQMGSNANRVVKMSEEQVISWGLRQGISLMQQQAANGQLLKDISADVQKMSDDADLMDEIDQLKQQNTRGVTAHDLWKQVIDVTSKFVSIDENGLYDEDNTSPNDAAVDLYARAEGNVAAAKENVAKAKAALMSASEQGSLAAVGAFTGSALANQEAQVQSDEATTRAAKQIAFLEQVENVLDQMGARAQQLAENDAKEEAVKVSSTPVSQMEVGQQFPVEWRGQQAMATVMGKDADGRSVVTVRDMDGEDIEAGIDDMSDADWEAVRVQPQETTTPEQVAPQVAPQVEPQPQQEVPQPAPQPQPTPTPVQPEPAPIPTTSDVQPSIEIPRDKEGKAEYDKITDPYVYAAAVTEEFGDEAIDVVNALIESEEAALEGAKKIKDTIKRFREQRESKARLELFNKVKDIIAPQEQTETPAEETTPVEEAPVEQPTAEAPIEETPTEEVPEETPEQPEQPTESVPDWTEDTAKSARERGYRMVDGERVDRQEPIDGVEGNEVEVKFSDTEKPKGKWKVVEAESLQPSHLNKRRNPRFFITEAQPKERKDNASDEASTKIAKDINPDEVMQGVTAYSGSPVINSRGEVIQGNNRTIGLQKMYESYPESQEKYKQALMDKAEQMGLDKEDIGKMQHPVLVRSVDVDDDTAIKLGQKTSQDTESGGKQRMGASQVRNGLGDKYANLIEMLFADTTEDEGIGEAIARNGVTALKYLWNQKVINNTQYQSAWENGDLTAEAKEDFRNIIMESLFEGGPDGLRMAFNMLPTKSQNAILQTIYRDAKSNDESKIKGDVQQAIMAFANLMGFKSFAAAKNQTEVENAVNSWLVQQNMFSDVANTEKYSNFALELAKRFKWQTLTGQRAFFNELYDKLQGVASEGLSMFEEVQQLGLAEAIKAVYGIDYLKPQQNNGISGSNVVANDNGTRQEGEQGRTGETESGEREESGERSADDRGGDERTDREGQETEIGEKVEEAAEVAPEDIETAAANPAATETNVEKGLTEEDVDAAEGIDTQTKLLAKEYIKGNKNELTKDAYEEVREYYAERGRRNPEQDSRTASGTQLASADNETADQRGGGQRRVEPGRVDRGGSQETLSENGRRGEDGTQQPSATAGEQSVDSGNGEQLGSVGQPADSGDTTGSGRSGGNGSNVRQPRGEKEGSRVSGTGTRGQSGTSQRRSTDEIDKDIADDLAAISSLFKEFVADQKKMGIAANPEEQAKADIAWFRNVRKAIFKLAGHVFERGYTQFDEWKNKIKDLLHSAIKNFREKLSDERLDQLLADAWECPFEYNGEVKTIREWASELHAAEVRKMLSKSIEEKRKEQEEANKRHIKQVHGDLNNIKETLPFLLPHQQENVAKAERQFFSEEHADREHGFGKGYCFTDGTGTGKTFTGLGIARRFVNEGKGRILILTTKTKVNDWVADGAKMGLDVTSLEAGAKKAGKTPTEFKGSGIVCTTYANARQNKALLEDTFDLVIYDESHYIMNNKGGEETISTKSHYMLTNKNIENALARLQENHPLWIKEQELVEERQQQEEIINKDDASYAAQQAAVNRISQIDGQLKQIKEQQKAELPAMREKAAEAAKITKSVFLSATPFKSIDNLEYAEGYLFSYPEEDPNTKGSSDHRSGKDEFKLRFFGSMYRWRHHQIEEHVQNLDAAVQQQQAFADRLMNTLGTMSGVVLDNGYDYSRHFPLVEVAMADQFNSAVEAINRDPALRVLGEYFPFDDYQKMSVLFETMKVAAMLPRIKEHLAKGRKVVIFNRRTNYPQPTPTHPNPWVPQNPFTEGLATAIATAKQSDEKKAAAIMNAVNLFQERYASLIVWADKLDYRLPAEQLKDAFGDKIEVINGKVTGKKRQAIIDKFNRDDDQGLDLLLGQEITMREGISIHDTTGNKQRVVMSLALPQETTTFIQGEGRIYRIGNKSNAIFEYPLLGINRELQLFALSFNAAVGVTENLAMGSSARNLARSIAKGVMEDSGVVPMENQGIGGREKDYGKSTRDAYSSAINDYYSNQKQKAGRENRLGEDYYATPEPLGFKMVQWLNLAEGEEVLEPSAGHGAIARYFPNNVRSLAIEPSDALFTMLALNTGGVDKDNAAQASGKNKFVQNGTFEDLKTINKYDAIAMNPPFGHAGATAIEHLEKAWQHLRNSGRIAIIVPTGAMDKKMEKWFDEHKNAVVVGEIKLPSVTFQQAGTSVSTRMLLIDRVDRASFRQKVAAKRVSLDMTGVQNIDEFFRELRDVDMPSRMIDPATKLLRHGDALRTKLVSNDIVDYKRNPQTDRRSKNMGKDMTVGEEGVSMYLSNKAKGMNYDFYYSQRASWNDIKKLRGREGTFFNARGYVYLSDLANCETLAEAKDKRLMDKWNSTQENFEQAKEFAEAMTDFIRRVTGFTDEQIRDYAAGKVDLFDYTKIKDNAQLTFQDLTRRYEDMEQDPMLQALFEQVSTIAERIGMKIETFNDPYTTVMGSYNPLTNTLRINSGRWNNPSESDSAKSQTILHELIHSVTSYALNAYDKGLPMSEGLKEACRRTYEIFENIKGDYPSYYGNTQVFAPSDAPKEARYGFANTHEMLSEMANPTFRKYLQKKGLWKKLVDGIKRILNYLGLQNLGMKFTQNMDSEQYRRWYGTDKENVETATNAGWVATNAFDELSETLDMFLDNFDAALYERRNDGIVRAKMVENDDLYRDQEREYEFGETLPIKKDADGRYRVEGLNDSYPNLDRLLDAWRDEHLDYFAEIRNGKLYIEPWNLPEPKTAKEKRYLQKSRERAWRNMHTKADDTIKKLGLQDRVTILDSTDGLEGKKKTAKGWFDPATGKIVIVMPNHRDPHDVMKTILHEGVAHYGLRQLVGNDNMNEFLDKVFEHASKDVRDRIIDLAMNKYNRNIRKATEEYLAGLAEDTNFEDATEKDWFKKIKGWFIQMLHKVGIDFGNFGEAVDNATFWGDRFTDNELRYLLWKSYRNLVADAESRTELARDVMMQSQLGVGNYAPQTVAAESMMREDETYGTNMADISGVISDKGEINNERLNEVIKSVQEGRAKVSRIPSGLGEAHETVPAIAAQAIAQGYFDSEFAGNWSGDGDIPRVFKGGTRQALKREVSKVGNIIKQWAKDNGYWFDEAQLKKQGTEIMGGAESRVFVSESGNTVVKSTAPYVHNGYVQLVIESMEMFGRVFQNTPYTIVGFSEENGHLCVVATQPYVQGMSLGEYAKQQGWVDEDGQVDYDRMMGYVDKAMREQFGLERRAGYGNYTDGTYNVTDAHRKNVIVDAEGNLSVIDASVFLNDDDYDNDDILFRDGEPVNKIADEYNRETGANVSGVNAVKRGWEKFARDQFDGYRPLEQMQKLIEKALGRKLRDSEKAYELATQLTSKTGQQIEREQLSYMVPVLQQVTDVIKALKDADGYSRDEAYEKVTNYMLAKHGLERNEWFKKQGKDEGDYAGLRGLAERLGYNPDDYKTAAEVTVKDMEGTMKAAGIDVNEFWKTVNALTNRMLEISYESGMIDKDTFEDLKKRHKYYVPLRGFAEGTAADLFDYVTQSPQFQNIFQKAKGRESMADDPLANLMSMLHSAIVIGNQNQVMQKIYNLAVNSNSDLLRVTKPWYVYNDATKTWEEKYPDIPEDATADEIDAIVKQFDADMAQLKANGKAKRKLNRIDVGKKMLNREKAEHRMIAYIDGQRVGMFVNGNPLVAQAMNRMNTQQLKKWMQGVQAVTRLYSAINTSWSPAFGPKNAARDIRMMLFGAYTTGGIKKMWQSARDIVKAGWTLPRLLITGKMDGGLVKALGKQKAAQLEQWWNEFLDNGGETGFTRTLNAEKAKGEVKDMIRHMLNGSKDGENRVRKYTIGLIEWIGRYSEDISRFAAYCQQRAQGESVLSSIQEAKNVTVNFNVKGGSDLAANMRALYSFFNASMQGINRMRRLATEHPGRFSAGIAAMMLGGAVLPWLNMAMFAMLGGDDDDWRKYEELTEYTANHNMILYVGNHKFISIPWSQELAPFNALGNIWFRQQMGWNKGRSVAEQWGDMFVDLSPISVASGNKPGVGLVKTVMPSFTTPIWESLFNEDFTGSPLYKDNQWNKYDAAWEKAYTGKTSQSVIDASKWLNEKTDIDINPAIAEHLFSGVLGGMGRSGDKLLRFFTNGFQLQDAPFIRTMMFDSNPKGYIGAVQREYGRNAYDVLDKVKNDVDDMDAMEFAQFSQTEEFEIANLVSVYKTGKDLAGNKKGIVGIDAMEKEYKKIAGASDGSEEYREQLEEIRNAITERKMEMLDEIQQIKYEHSGYLRKRIIEYVNEVEQESKEKNARKNGKEK